jgi:competence protein ComEA
MRCVRTGGGGTMTRSVDMRKRTKRILTGFVLVAFLLGMGIGAVIAQEQVKININKATVEELCTLKRIGPSYAQRIVDYREQNGPFEKPEDIMKVRGIGLQTFEANKEIIVCE